MKLQKFLVDETNQEMYRQLTLKFHPDRGGDIDIMKKINMARDAEDWDKIRRYFDLYIKTNVKNPEKMDENFQIYVKWAKEISKAHNIRIIIDSQGKNLNAWIFQDKKGTYMQKIERFKTKEDFEKEAVRKATSLFR
jgi:hypothetical protein